jgi:hypothetical protein
MLRRDLQWLVMAAALAQHACDSGGAPGSAATTARASDPAAPTSAAGPLIEWVAAPDGDVADLVMHEAERSKRDGRALLVYVGATWCEPCQRFHKAADNGEITATLPRLRMLEFDLDRDAARLEAAGYGSKMIPLFAVPGADGRATSARMEGSIKGEGAVANIVPRLRALLERAKGS